MLNQYKSKLLISTLCDTKPFNQSLFKSVQLEKGNHQIVKYLEMPQMRYLFADNVLRLYELSNVLIKEYHLKEKIVNIVLDDTCHILFLLLENRIVKITTGDCTEHLFTFKMGSSVEIVEGYVVVRCGNRATVFDFDLNVQNSSNLAIQTIRNNNNTFIRIKAKQIDFQTARNQILSIDFLQTITYAISNTLLSHIYVGADDGTIFVQSLENRPHRKIKFLEFAVKKLVLSIAEDILIAYDKECLVAVCTKTFVLLEKYAVKEITNVSVLDDFDIERVIGAIDIPSGYLAIGQLQ